PLPDGRLPLLRAIDNGAEDVSNSLALLSCLLEAGANPCAMDEDGQGCSLHVAAAMLAREPSFALPTLSLLLERTGKPLDSLVDAEGNTAIAVAVMQGKQLVSGERDSHEAAEEAMGSAVQLLLKHGSGLMLVPPPLEPGPTSAAPQKRRSGNVQQPRSTVLHLAAEWAPSRCLEPLLNSAQASAAMRIGDEEGHQPLHKALAAGRSTNVSLLLSHFPDAAIFDGRGGGGLHDLIRSSTRHPARHSARADYPACLRLLVEQAGRGVNQKDAEGRTALLVGLSENVDQSLVRELIRLRARIDSTDQGGMNALMIAAASGNADALSLLLDRGAEVSGGEGLGAGEGRREDTLCEGGRGMESGAGGGSSCLAPIDAVNAQGRTALMLAAKVRSVECVDVLLNHGSDLQRLDGSGASTLLQALSGFDSEAGADLVDAVGVIRSLLTPPPAAAAVISRAISDLRSAGHA
ncbi:MAG: hypothetical protein SGPRY_002452, partial [Prymnesium sp.]